MCARRTFAGISVSNSTFNSLVQRYSHHDGKMYFDGYIHCIARLCTMFGMRLVIFTFAEEVMFCSSLCACVCVCLCANYLKTLRADFDVIFWRGKSVRFCWRFGSWSVFPGFLDPNYDPNLRIVRRFLMTFLTGGTWPKEQSIRFWRRSGQSGSRILKSNLYLLVRFLYTAKNKTWHPWRRYALYRVLYCYLRFFRLLCGRAVRHRQLFRKMKHDTFPSLTNGFCTLFCILLCLRHCYAMQKASHFYVVRLSVCVFVRSSVSFSFCDAIFAMWWIFTSLFSVVRLGTKMMCLRFGVATWQIVLKITLSGFLFALTMVCIDNGAN